MLRRVLASWTGHATRSIRRYKALRRGARSAEEEGISIGSSTSAATHPTLTIDSISYSFATRIADAWKRAGEALGTRAILERICIRPRVRAIAAIASLVLLRRLSLCAEPHGSSAVRCGCLSVGDDGGCRRVPFRGTLVHLWPRVMESTARSIRYCQHDVGHAIGTCVRGSQSGLGSSRSRRRHEVEVARLLLTGMRTLRARGETS